MDDLLIKVLARLLKVHESLGRRAYEDAAHRALLAIALAAEIEARRRAGTLRPPSEDPGVVRFPPPRPGRRPRRPGGDHDE